jgi:hypothetical protein
LSSRDELSASVPAESAAGADPDAEADGVPEAVAPGEAAVADGVAVPLADALGCELGGASAVMADSGLAAA